MVNSGCICKLNLSFQVQIDNIIGFVKQLNNKFYEDYNS